MKAMKVCLIVVTTLVVALFVGMQFYLRLLVDHTPPTITMDEEIITVSVQDGDEALLTGVHAEDDSDGDLTSQVMVRNVSQLISRNTAKVSYIVFDSSDNMSTASRTVCYSDYETPTFRLTKPLCYHVGETVTLADRLFAIDAVSGNISDAVRLSAASLDNSTPGIYPVTVQVTNALGDTAFLPLQVIISPDRILNPIIELKQWLVYIEKNAAFAPEDYFSLLRPSGQNSAPGTYSDLNVTNNVDTSTPGAYDVFYTYTNSHGYEATVCLCVVVEE